MSHAISFHKLQTDQPIVREHSVLAFVPRRAAAVVAVCGVLAGCVAPHQHAFDEALDRCQHPREATLPLAYDTPDCAQAAQLGRIVEQEKAEQAANAAAFASGMLAVSAGLAAAAAQRPRYVAAPVYVYCPYGC